MRNFLSTIIIFVVVLGCKEVANENEYLNKNVTDESGIEGAYDYKLFDKNGNQAGEGVFILIPDGDLYTGTWESSTGDSGNVFCTVEEGFAYIHLNIPGLLPQEYLLKGSQESKSIKGQWSINVEVFPMEPDFHGTFEAFQVVK
ncbi:hypothetical protein JNL27_09600 [bacterium]|nr:hypothetical protein [bacterium]